MLSMLLAYDTSGNVVATLDHMVARDEGGEVIGLVDFVAQESQSPLTDVWFCEQVGDNLAGLPLAYQCPGSAMHTASNGSRPCPGGEWRQPAAGSGTWPEWLGSGAHGFTVERSNGRISALVHKVSGHRRERAAIETAIAKRIAAAGDEPADIRDLVGGPDRPLLLNEEGRTMVRVPVQRPNLPIIELG